MRTTDHAREKMLERGVSEEEVKTVLERGRPCPAKGGRKGREMWFDFGAIWQAKLYPAKLIRVIYAEKGGETLVITVLAKYGRREG